MRTDFLYPVYCTVFESVLLFPATSFERWCISQPLFPTWFWWFSWSEAWPSRGPLTVSSTSSHQSGRNWWMERCNDLGRLVFSLNCPSKVWFSFLGLMWSVSSVRCGKTRPLRSFSRCLPRGEAWSRSPPTISSTITATGKHTKGKIMLLANDFSLSP